MDCYLGRQRFHHCHRRCLENLVFRHHRCRFRRSALGCQVADPVVGRFVGLVDLVDRFGFDLVAAGFDHFGCFGLLDLVGTGRLVGHLVGHLVVADLVRYPAAVLAVLAVLADPGLVGLTGLVDQIDLVDQIVDLAVSLDLVGLVDLVGPC